LFAVAISCAPEHEFTGKGCETTAGTIVCVIHERITKAAGGDMERHRNRFNTRQELAE
jgi:hypothetical protein